MPSALSKSVMCRCHQTKNALGGHVLTVEVCGSMHNTSTVNIFLSTCFLFVQTGDESKCGSRQPATDDVDLTLFVLNMEHFFKLPEAPCGFTLAH